MNSEQQKAIGHDIDQLSIEADRMSHRLSRLAETFGVKPPAQQAVRSEPTPAQINSACLSFRHDFGLLSRDDQMLVTHDALEWLRAWRKEGLL